MSAIVISIAFLLDSTSTNSKIISWLGVETSSWKAPKSVNRKKSVLMYHFAFMAQIY